MKGSLFFSSYLLFLHFGTQKQWHKIVAPNIHVFHFRQPPRNLHARSAKWTWNDPSLPRLAARRFPPKSKGASHGGSCLATPQENNGVSVCPQNHQRFSAVPMATAGGTLEGPQTGAAEQMPIINVAIWRCQSCQSAVRGGRPSPRPVTGPLGWVKNYCPAVWLCVCQCVYAGLGGPPLSTQPRLRLLVHWQNTSPISTDKKKHLIMSKNPTEINL